MLNLFQNLHLGSFVVVSKVILEGLPGRSVPVSVVVLF